MFLIHLDYGKKYVNKKGTFAIKILKIDIFEVKLMI